jgi:two-component system response regulator DesR
VFRLVIAGGEDTDALARTFDAVDGVDVVGTATDAATAVEVVRWTSPDFVVVDLEMPPSGGLAVIRAVTHDRPRTKVVVIAGAAPPDVVQEAVRAGACAYLLKLDPGPPEQGGLRLVPVGGGTADSGG